MPLYATKPVDHNVTQDHVEYRPSEESIIYNGNEYVEYQPFVWVMFGIPKYLSLIRSYFSHKNKMGRILEITNKCTIFVVQF